MNKKENEPPLRLLDDLFRKTKATPCIYWLPLTAEQVRTFCPSSYQSGTHSSVSHEHTDQRKGRGTSRSAGRTPSQSGGGRAERERPTARARKGPRAARPRSRSPRSGSRQQPSQSLSRSTRSLQAVQSAQRRRNRHRWWRPRPRSSPVLDDPAPASGCELVGFWARRKKLRHRDMQTL